MDDWTPTDLGVPRADDLRSPIYDLREFLESFPAEPHPISPHVTHQNSLITGSESVSATDTQLCKECGRDHELGVPCPPMGGGQALMPDPIISARYDSARYDSEGEQVGDTFNVPGAAPQPPGVYYDTEWEEQGQPPARDRYPNQAACPQCGAMNPDAGGNLYEQRCTSCGASMDGSMPQLNPAQQNETGRQLAWNDENGNPLTQMMQGDVLTNGIKRLGGGVNDTYTGWIDGDGKAVIKPKNSEITGQSMRNSITPGGDAEREYAAYLMSHHLDLPGARVPTTRLGQVQFPPVANNDWSDETSENPLSGNASLQHYVDGGETYGNAYNIPLDQRRNVGILDSLIGNHDRHGANGMIAYDDDGNMHHFPIDHGLSFPDRMVHQGGHNADITNHFWDNQAPDQPPMVGGDGPYLTDEERQHVSDKVLNNPELWQQLHQTVGPFATDLAKKRAQYMVDKGHMLNNEKMTEAHAGGDDPHLVAPFYGMSPWQYADVHGKPLSGIQTCDRCGEEYDGKLGPLDDGGKTMGRDHVCAYCFGKEYPKEWEKAHNEDAQRRREEAPDWVAKPFVPQGSSQSGDRVIKYDPCV